LLGRSVKLIERTKENVSRDGFVNMKD
jgi:hypothetical protein